MCNKEVKSNGHLCLHYGPPFCHCSHRDGRPPGMTNGLRARLKKTLANHTENQTCPLPCLYLLSDKNIGSHLKPISICERVPCSLGKYLLLSTLSILLSRRFRMRTHNCPCRRCFHLCQKKWPTLAICPSYYCSSKSVAEGSPIMLSRRLGKLERCL